MLRAVGFYETTSSLIQGWAYWGHMVGREGIQCDTGAIVLVFTAVTCGTFCQQSEKWHKTPLVGFWVKIWCVLSWLVILEKEVLMKCWPYLLFLSEMAVQILPVVTQLTVAKNVTFMWGPPSVWHIWILLGTGDVNADENVKCLHALKNCQVM